MQFPEGSVGLVTGAARGVGRAIAMDLARNGLFVLVNYSRSEDEAKDTVRAIEADGGAAVAVLADVSNEEAVTELFRDIRRTYGRLDVLVTNAGITMDGFLVAMSLDQFRRVIDVNLVGTFLCCREAMRIMQHQRSGSIVTISSAAIVDSKGLPGQANYVAAKGGIISFTKAVACEAAAFGVRANVVAPGFVSTDMTGALPAALRKKYESALRTRRMAQPEEIAPVVTFLASSQSSYVTGSVYVADGGGFA